MGRSLIRAMDISPEGRIGMPSRSENTLALNDCTYGNWHKVYFGMLRLRSFTRKRFASVRFRSCDEWMFEVNFR